MVIERDERRIPGRCAATSTTVEPESKKTALPACTRPAAASPMRLFWAVFSRARRAKRPFTWAVGLLTAPP